MIPAEMDKTAIPGSPSQTASSTMGIPMPALIIRIRNWFSRGGDAQTEPVPTICESDSFAEPTLPFVERVERFVDVFAVKIGPPGLR